MVLSVLPSSCRSIGLVCRFDCAFGCAMENGSLLELVGNVVGLAACPGTSVSTPWPCTMLLSSCCQLRQLCVSLRAVQIQLCWRSKLRKSRREQLWFFFLLFPMPQWLLWFLPWQVFQGATGGTPAQPAAASCSQLPGWGNADWNRPPSPKSWEAQLAPWTCTVS